jgi:hypothetical protein
MTPGLQLVSLSYVTSRLGLAKASVIAMCRQGAIPYHQITAGPSGRAFMVFEAEDIERLRERRYRARKGATA